MVTTRRSHRPRRLNKTAIDALKPEAEDYRVYDSDIANFWVRVAPSGYKSWWVQYRVAPGGRKARVRGMTLGSTTVVTAEQARKQALAVRAAAAQGLDPAADRLARRLELTVDGLIDTYLADGLVVQSGPRTGGPMKAAAAANVRGTLRHHVSPLIGGRKLSDVTAGDIERMARAIASGKTAKPRAKGQRGGRPAGGDSAAAKAVRVVSAMFSYAVRRGLMAVNPCTVAKVRRSDNKRDRYLDLAEITALGAAIATLEAAGKLNRKACDIVRLLLFTGCRRSEINQLRWDEVDLKGMRLVLAESKTGKSVRPLAAPAAALLARIPRVDGSPWVFPGKRLDRPYMGLQPAWAAILKEAGLDRSGVTLHTLRHSVGSQAVSGGESLPLTGSILGHVDQRSTSIYAHLQREPARAAADRAIAPIAAALDGKPAAEVIDIAKAR